MSYMSVYWIKCEGGAWCPFRRVNLMGVHDYGVYIIWNYEHLFVQTIYIGMGQVAERIMQHRIDEKFKQYEINRELLVTWAEIPPESCGGVEHYLANAYPPAIGSRHSADLPIRINVPWIT